MCFFACVLYFLPTIRRIKRYLFRLCCCCANQQAVVDSGMFRVIHETHKYCIIYVYVHDKLLFFYIYEQCSVVILIIEFDVYPWLKNWYYIWKTKICILVVIINCRNRRKHKLVKEQRWIGYVATAKNNWHDEVIRRQ